MNNSTIYGKPRDTGTLLLSALILLGGIMIAGCGGEEFPDTFTRIDTRKVIRIGTDATYPPFETRDIDTGELVGFDIDLVTAICTDLGWEPEFIVTPFDGMIPGLLDEKYDLIISAMTITPERARIIAFTNPYYWASQAIAVRSDEKEIRGKDDLRGRIIGTQLGTTGEMVAKRIPDAEVISFDNIGAAFLDLSNGKVDAVINDKPTTEKIIAIKGDAKIVGKPLTSERYGMAVRSEDKRLLLKINSALSIMEVSGRLQAVKDKWFR